MNDDLPLDRESFFFGGPNTLRFRLRLKHKPSKASAASTDVFQIQNCPFAVALHTTVMFCNLFFALPFLLDQCEVLSSEKNPNLVWMISGVAQ